MVHDLIWAPDLFGSKKFGHCMKTPHNNFHARINFLGDQVSRGPNFLEPKLLGDQISWGPKSQGLK